MIDGIKIHEEIALFICFHMSTNTIDLSLIIRRKQTQTITNKSTKAKDTTLRGSHRLCCQQRLHHLVFCKRPGHTKPECELRRICKPVAESSGFNSASCCKVGGVVPVGGVLRVLPGESNQRFVLLL